MCRKVPTAGNERRNGITKDVCGTKGGLEKRRCNSASPNALQLSNVSEKSAEPSLPLGGSNFEVEGQGDRGVVSH